MVTLEMAGAKNLSPHVLDDINAFIETNAANHMATSLKGRTKTIARGFNLRSMNGDETLGCTMPFRIQTPSTPERSPMHYGIIISGTCSKNPSINLIRFCMFGA